MTLWVSRDGQAITIHGNLGLHVTIEDRHVTDFTITESAAYLRHFWGQLGHVLDEAEKTEEEA